MELPLFPLHAVLFPGSSLPLHVFEERYREMMRVILDGDRRLGIVAIRSGMEAGGPARIYDIGSVATVEQVQRSQDGSMDIIVTAKERFRIDERLPDDPYPRAHVTVLADEPGDEVEGFLTAARAATFRYLSAVARLQEADIKAPSLSDDAVVASYKLAAVLELDIPERQRMLECPDAHTRLALLSDLARREALLLETVGPSVGRPRSIYSPN